MRMVMSAIRTYQGIHFGKEVGEDSKRKEEGERTWIMP